MEVLTIEHSAFQQLISKIEAMDEFIRKAKLEQQSSLDDDWVDGQAVCEYLCICDKTLQRLRSAGKITYSTIGNKTIYLDPKDGKSAMSRTLDGVLPVLKERKDIENHEEVIVTFIKPAQELIRRFEQGGYIYTGKRYIGGGHK